jgi:predicted nucleotidyltransferase
MQSNKETILDTLRHLPLHFFGVRRIGLFGSFAHGTQHSDSDIDLLVEFEPEKKTFDNFMNLAFCLEDELGRKVELVTPESLSPYIGPHILQEVEYAV